MAYEAVMTCYAGTIAGADLSAHQYKLVKWSGTNNTVILCAALTDSPCGILQNAPLAGQGATVCFDGMSKLIASAAMAQGTHYGTAADGRGAVKVPGTDTTHYVCGRVVEGVSNANEFATVSIEAGSVHRAT